MTRKSTPSIDRDDLRDQADPERVDRIWERLSPELESLSARVEEGARPRRSYGSAWIAAAAVAAAFAGGVWVGHSRTGETQKTEEHEVPVAANETAIDVFAAGTESRTFALPDGSKLLLQPGSTVELAAPSENGVKLRLLQGSASLDTTHAVAGVQVVAGAAMLSAPAGGSFAVTRNERDLDVVVSGGYASIDSPSGHTSLAVGQSARGIPIVTLTATHDEAPSPPHVLATPSPRHEPLKVATNDGPLSSATSHAADPSPPAPTAASWMAKIDGDDQAGAAALLEKAGGIASAIENARSGGELVRLGEIAPFMHRPDLRWFALQRLCDEFPGDPNATTGAFSLANHFLDIGNTKLADKYMGLAKHGRNAEDAICEQLKHGNASSPTIVQAAREYEASFPSGYCKDVADQILGDAQAADPKKSDDNHEGAPPAPSASASAAASAGPAAGPPTAASAKPMEKDKKPNATDKDGGEKPVGKDAASNGRGQTSKP